MIDPETGNLLTTEEKIEKAALKVYKDRLRSKPIHRSIEQIKEAKEKLCENNIKIAKYEKTPAWTMDYEGAGKGFRTFEKAEIKRPIWFGQ